MRLRFVAALALLAALPFAPSARAQEDFATERAAFEHDLRKEGLIRLVELAAREHTDPARRALIEAARERVTDDYIRRHGQIRDADRALRQLFEAEIQSGRLSAADLKVDWWYGRNYRDAYRLKPIAEGHLPAANGYSPPVREGYLPEVAGIDTRAEHSMTDLRDYLGNRFTHAALERIVNSNAKVEIHTGNATETLSSFRNRGYEIIGEVTSANGNYERLFMARSPTGELTYAVTGIEGLDRVRHLSSLLRFAGEGVPAERMSIHGDIEALKESNVREFRTALEHLGESRGLAWIGFRGTVRSELERRALNRSGAEHLRDVLGPDPYQGLLERLAAERDASTGSRRSAAERALELATNNEALRIGLAEAPERVFAEAERLERFEAGIEELKRLSQSRGEVRLFNELLAEGQLRLRGGADPRTVTASRPLQHGSFRADELRVRTAEGTTSLKLINNYYGDVMGDMARALVSSGYRNIAYYGTAGGIADGVRIGDVHVPGEVTDSQGRRTSVGLENALIDHIRRNGSGSLGESLKTDVRLTNVFSPVQETMPWLEAARRRGVGSVEVEISYLTDKIAEHNRRVGMGEQVRFMSSVMISDIPGSEHTLGNNNGSTAGRFERMVDHYISALGIQDIALLDRAELERQGRRHTRDAAGELAERLIAEAQGRGKSGALHSENVAEHLRELLSREAITEALREGKTLAELGLTESNRNRIESELRTRYSDVELTRSLEATNGSLSRAVAEFQRAFPGAAYELKVAEIGRGRFSPVEGLTVDLQGTPEMRERFREILREVNARSPGAAELRLGEVGPNASSLGRGELLIREVGTLERVYSEGLLKHRGLNLHSSGQSVNLTARVPLSSVTAGGLLAMPEAPAQPARRSPLEKFRDKATARGVEVIERPVGDPMLSERLVNTVVEADGRIRVVTAAGAEIPTSTLAIELGRIIEFTNIRDARGAAELGRLVEAARGGDPVARARLMDAAIKAHRATLLAIPAGSAERAVVEAELRTLEAQRDPYVGMRDSRGRVQWERVRNFARQHGAGAASFTLGLFLMELARVVETGDETVIEEFFAGLATTDFWLNYGLFSVGAEAGSVAYARFLERFVKPSFVSGVLKANVALASGMALSEIALGHFDGRAYAINVTGLMLSSTAVKAGLAGLRWVVSLERMSGARRLAQALRLGSAPGWIYAGVETAVVLYFGAEISQGISELFERHRLRRDLGNGLDDLLSAARSASSSEDEALREALADVSTTFSSWRNLEIQGAIAASQRLQDELTRLGREAMRLDSGYARSETLAEDDPDRYGALLGALETVRARRDAELDADLRAAVDDYYARYRRVIRDAYEADRRRSAFDARDPDPSRNRGQSYEDEAAALRAAADAATNPEVASWLRERADVVESLRARDVEVLESSGITGALDAGLDRR